MQALVESDACTLCDVMLAVKDLYSTYATISCEDTKIFLLEKLELRWKKFFDPKLLILSVALHPAHRMSSFRPNPQIKNCFLIKKWAAEYCNELCDSPADQVTSSAVSSYMLSHAPYTDKVTSDEDVRPFWQLASDVFPALSKIAILLYEVCPHAAGLERVWSTMNNIMTKARNRTANAKARNLAVVKMHLLKENEIRRVLPKLPSTGLAAQVSPAKDLDTVRVISDLNNDDLIDGYDNSEVAVCTDEILFDKLFFEFEYLDEDFTDDEIMEPNFITLKQIFDF